MISVLASELIYCMLRLNFQSLYLKLVILNNLQDALVDAPFRCSF